MMKLRKTAGLGLGAAASLLLLAACGGEAEEPETAAMDVPVDETVTDSVDLPATMPSPGDFADPNAAGTDNVSNPVTGADETSTPPA